MNRLQQFIQKHNIKITRHDRLYYGKYYYSLKLILENNSTELYRFNWSYPLETQRMNLMNKYNVFLRIEAGILTLYSKTTDELLDSYCLLKDFFGTQNKNIKIRVEKFSECPANLVKKTHRIRKSYPYDLYRTEILVRKARGRSKTPSAKRDKVERFADIYPQDVYFPHYKKAHFGTHYTIWLKNRDLLAFAYIFFAGAITRANQFYLEGETINE